MRSVSAAALAELKHRVTECRLLIELSLTSTLRYSNGDETISWNSQSWLARQFIVEPLNWGPMGDLEGRVTFQAVDKIFIATFAAEGVQGSSVVVYAADKGALAVADVETLIDSEIDDLEWDANSVTFSLRRQERLAPNEYCDADSGFTFTDPPGTYHFPSGVVVVTRNDGNF